MTYTPGPWVNMDKDPFWGEIRACETFDLIAVMPELDDRTDDFNLIAAAPELLEACKRVIEDLTDENGCNWCDRASHWPHED